MTTEVEVIFENVEQPLLRVAATVAAAATMFVAGSDVALSHWKAAFVFERNGQPSAVTLVEGIRDRHGRLTCVRSTPDIGLYRATPEKKIVLGKFAIAEGQLKDVLESEPFTNLGAYHFSKRNCQYLVVELLRRLGVPVPSSLRTLKWLIRRCKGYAAFVGVFLGGAAARAIAS